MATFGPSEEAVDAELRDIFSEFDVAPPLWASVPERSIGSGSGR